ncbi:MAG: hypothetical protein HY721_18585 [Planctomycetes bacterium]|nr:hypothetical protein [Planctomycetota bacterium]
MRKLAFWILSLVLVLLLLSVGFLAWFAMLGGGDDPAPNDQDLFPTFAAVPEGENGFALLRELEGLVKLPGGDPDLAWPTTIEPEQPGEALDASGPVHLLDRMLEGKAWDEILAEAILERNGRALELIAEALARPSLQVPQPALGASVSYVRDVFGAKFVLAVRAHALARAGRTGEGVESALQAVRLGRRLANCEGAWIDYMVGTGVEQMGLQALRLLVPRVGPEELHHALSELKGLQLNAGGLRAALRGEYLLFTRGLADLASGKLTVHDMLRLTRGENLSPSAASQDVFERMDEVIMTSRYCLKPHRTRRLVGEALRVLLEEIDLPCAQRTHHLSERCGVTTPLDRTVSNGIGAWIAHWEIALMECALRPRDQLELAFSATRVLLAIRAHRLEAGKLPEALAELVPRYLEAVPRDPFDGQPLRYSREKLKVWSVGRDLEDQGGGELGEDGEWTPPEDQEPTYKVEP